MAFMAYDLGLLVIFVIFISSFLYTRRKNLKKEGLLFLYKTSWGIKLIDYVGNKYQKTLKILSYVAITLGYFLMGLIVYLFGKIIYVYIFFPEIVRAVKIPPVTPLIPYLPQIFKLDFLPPFYFTYWIIILAVIAISHELAHGIFAAYHKVRTKTTGFGFFPFFFPVFLAAFVELDEEKMTKRSKFAQMSVLSAGTFANVITAIFFLLILWLFFSLAFAPSGVVFDTYAYSMVSLPAIASINGIQIDTPSYEKIVELSEGKKLSEIKTNNKTYLINQFLLQQQDSNPEFIYLFSDAPAIKSELSGPITKINGITIDSREKLGEELEKYSPGETIIITTKTQEGILDNQIILEEHPEDKEKPWLGIAFIERAKGSGIMSKFAGSLNPFKKPNVHYEPKFDGFSLFIYNLLWWIVLISLSVALVNMLPMGIFDGGRFFYLTMLGITGNQNIARKSFKYITKFLLFLLILLMVFWAFNMFN